MKILKNPVEFTIQEALKDYGLSDKEIQVYIACLQLGTATANSIADKADLNRSTTYDIIKVLLESGIASRVVRKKTLHFEVVSPERLLAKLEEKKAKLIAVLPELKGMQQRVIVKPVAELYEGKEGLKTILQDILNAKNNTDVISTSKIFKILTFYFPKYIVTRKELGIFSRVIQEESTETRELKKKDKEELRETRSLPNFEVNSAVFIYGDKIAVIKLVKEEPIGIIITDQVIAGDWRSYFRILWNAAKK